MPMTIKTVYSTGEAAKICKVSQQTIVRCFDSGRLKGFRVPGSIFRRIPQECLYAFMRENKIPLCQERTASIVFPGVEGMAMLEQAMAKFRTTPPEIIAGMHIACVKDYLNMTAKTGDEIKPMSEEPKEDRVIIELEEPGNRVAIRPSQTNPQFRPSFANPVDRYHCSIKPSPAKSSKIMRASQLKKWQKNPPHPVELIIQFKMTANLPLSECQDLISGIAILQSRLDAMESDLRAFIE